MRWTWLVIGLLAVPLLVILADRSYHLLWSGYCDLEVVFVVTDADSGHPLDAATVEIQDFGGEYEGGCRNHEMIEHVLSTDSQGIATRMCPRNTCTGSDSLFGLSNTFSTRPPDWRVRASVPGYERGDWVRTGARGHGHEAKHDSTGTKLTISLPLRKSP